MQNEMFNSNFQTFFNLKKDLKCNQHPSKSLDRVIIKGNEPRTLICSICEYEFKKSKIFCSTIPLEAFLSQLEEIENKYCKTAESIKAQNKSFRETIINQCQQSEYKLKELIMKIKQNARYEQELMKQLLNKAKYDTKTVIDKMLGDYNSTSCFEGLYQNIENKFIFDEEEREIINLETYKLAQEQAIQSFNSFKLFTNEVDDQLASLYEKINQIDNSLKSYFIRCEGLGNSFLFCDTNSQNESIKIFKPENNEELHEILLKLSTLSRGAVSIDLTNNTLDKNQIKNFTFNFSALQNLPNFSQIDFSIELKGEDDNILNNLIYLFSVNEASFNKIGLIINQGSFSNCSIKECIDTAISKSKQFTLQTNLVKINENSQNKNSDKRLKKSNENSNFNSTNKQSEDNELEEQEEGNFYKANNDPSNFQFGTLSMSQQSRYKESNLEEVLKNSCTYTKICTDNTNMINNLKNTIQESIRSLQGCIEKTKTINNSMSESKITVQSFDQKLCNNVPKQFLKKLMNSDEKENQIDFQI